MTELQSHAEPLLRGVKVVDLSRVLAGPYATMVLSQLGAEVIKVEMPETGDDSRAFGPFVNGKSLYFSSINANKKSIALNLKVPEDRAIFESLLKEADVLVENYRPGTMEKLGYGWETLHSRFPRLIYGAASGFGDTGPYSRRGAYDMVVQGMGGIMSMTGCPDSPPTRVGVSIGDITAGLYLVIGLNAALYQRQLTGIGHKIDVAMLDCQVSILENAITAYCATGHVAGKLGSCHPSIAPFAAFKSQDSHIIIAAGNDHLFQEMCRAIGRPDLLSDPRFKTNGQRFENNAALTEEMEKTLRTRTTAEWLEVLDAAGVPSGPINTVAEMVRNPQVLARNMLVRVADPEAGEITVTGNPVKVDGVPDPETYRPAPLLDADRDAILASLASRVTGR